MKQTKQGRCDQCRKGDRTVTHLLVQWGWPRMWLCGDCRKMLRRKLEQAARY